MKLCYIDAFSGISGDMTVGALLDAGASFEGLREALSSFDTGASFRFEKTKRHGIAAGKFYVDTTETKAHRHLHHIVKMIEGAPLSDRAKRNSIAVFDKLAQAEAKMHATTIEKVHFHEVGAVDSICDIVGACYCFDNLAIDAVACSAINTGSGTVNTEHGVLPIPAPATAELLTGKPVYARGPQMELTTPTGAAIVSTLAAQFGPMPPMVIESSGYGAGDKDLKEQANVVRMLIGQASGATESTTVSVLEANIDDASPQVLGHAMERLLAEGALDVTLTPIYMKKSRPGVTLSVIAKPEQREQLASIMLAETTTLGLRTYSAERRVQARQFADVATKFGNVRIKVAQTGSFTPEYDDCRKLALAHNVPLKEVLAEAGAAYLNSSR